MTSTLCSFRKNALTLKNSKENFLVLRFKATNEPPYPFEWVDYDATRLDYAAALSRISARYQQRF